MIHTNTVQNLPPPYPKAGSMRNCNYPAFLGHLGGGPLYLCCLSSGENISVELFGRIVYVVDFSSNEYAADRPTDRGRGANGLHLKLKVGANVVEFLLWMGWKD